MIFHRKGRRQSRAFSFNLDAPQGRVADEPVIARQSQKLFNARTGQQFSVSAFAGVVPVVERGRY